MTEKTEVTKLFNINYILLIIVSLIIAMGYSMISTLISPYAVKLGASLAVAGTLTGIFSIAALVTRPFGGIATDLLNKKYICIVSTIVMSAAMMGHSVAPNMRTLFILRILHGVAFGISGTANLALVSEFIPKERLGEGLGYFGLGQILAQMCGPNFGVMFKDRFGYNSLFELVSVLTLLAVALLVLFKYERGKTVKKPKGKFKISFNNLIAKECIVYALVGGMFSLGNGIINSFLILLGEEKKISNITLFFSLSAIVLFCMRLLIGRVIDKTNLSFIVNLSLVLTALSMFFVGTASGLLLILIAAIFKAIGQGGGQISLQSACIKRVDALRIGIATSTYYIGADIGQGLGPVIGGKISEIYGYQTMFYCITGLMIVILIMFNIYQFILHEKSKKQRITS